MGTVAHCAILQTLDNLVIKNWDYKYHLADKDRQAEQLSTASKLNGPLSGVVLQLISAPVTLS